MLLFHTSLHTRRAVKGGGNVYHLPFPCPELQPRCPDPELQPRALRPFLSTLSGVARGSLQAGADASRAVGLQFALSPAKHAALIEALGDGREHAVRFVPDAVSRWSTLRDGLVADACRDGFGDAAVGLDGSLDVLVQVAHVGLRGTLELLGDGGEGGEGGEGGAGGDPRPRKHEDMRLILGGDWLKSADAAALVLHASRRDPELRATAAFLLEAPCIIRREWPFSPLLIAAVNIALGPPAETDEALLELVARAVASSKQEGKAFLDQVFDK